MYVHPSVEFFVQQQGNGMTLMQTNSEAYSVQLAQMELKHTSFFLVVFSVIIIR